MSVELLEGIKCGNCSGRACCHDIDMTLNADEIKNLRKAGSIIKIRGSVGRRGGDQKAVHLEGPCGNLGEDGMCVVHGTNLQPLECQGYHMGGFSCQARRAKILRGPFEVPVVKE